MAGDGAGHDAAAGARRQPGGQPAWVEPAPGLVDHAQVHDSGSQRIGQRRGRGHGYREGDGRRGRPAVDAADVSALVFESETLFHGQASGIDNTVIAYEQPVWFVRGQAPQPFRIGQAFTIVIGDTGIASPTRLAVGDVRAGWQADWRVSRRCSTG